MANIVPPRVFTMQGVGAVRRERREHRERGMIGTLREEQEE